jgi:hypothetical protein
MKVSVVVAIAGIVLATSSASASDKQRLAHRHRLPQASASSGVSTNGSNTVYSAGAYVGSDPDARTRMQLLQDYNRGVNFPGGM